MSLTRKNLTSLLLNYPKFIIPFLLSCDCLTHR